MARLLGEARVSVLPDGTRFRPEAEAAVKKATEGIKGKIKLDFDSRGMRAQAVAAGAEIIAMQNRVAKARQADAAAEARDIGNRTKMYAGMFDQISKSEADQAKQESAMAKARDSAARSLSRQINAISKQQAAAANAELKSAAAQQASVNRIAKARQDDILSQQKGIADTQKMYSRMFDELNKRDKVKVNLDGSLAEVEALSLREKLKAALSDIKAKVTVDRPSIRNATSSILSSFGGSFRGRVEKQFEAAGSGGGKSFISSFSGAFTQSNAIAAAVVAGLAALPALVGAVGVLGGIALGAGIVIGAEVLIKSRLKTLTADIKAQTAILNAKTSTAANKQAAQQALASDRAQVAALNNQRAAFTKLDNAVKNLRNSFLNFAAVVSKPLIGPFSAAINHLSAQLDGPLRGSFTALFKAVGPLVKPVVDSLLSIVNGILPGMTFMLNRARGPLAALFEGFGKIVGTKLGDWFKAATPYIAASSKYFLALVSALGSTVTWLIRFGGETAKAFGGSQFKGFGSLIQSIAESLLKVVIPAFEGWTQVMLPVVKEVLQILQPLLAFLAMHPGLVKAIAEIAAAYLILDKAMALLIITTKALGLSITALPWVALAAAIIIATILIIQHWGPIAAFFTGLWKKIWSGFLGPMVHWFKDNWQLFAFTPGIIIKYWKPISGFFVNIWKHIWSGFIGPMINAFTNTVPQAFGHVVNVITGIFKPLASVIGGIWGVIYRITKNFWNAIALAVKIPALIIVGIVGEAWLGIKNLTGLVWPWIYRTIKDVWGHIENVTTGIVKPMVSFVVGAWHALMNATGAAYKWIFNTIKGAWGHIENVTTGIVKPMVTWVSSTWRVLMGATAAAYKWIFNTIKDAWGHIENATTGIIKPMISWIGSAWNFLKNITRAAFNWVHDAIINPLQKAYNWVAHNFVSGIKLAFSGLVGVVKSIWNGLKAVVASPINFVITKVWNPFAGFVNRGLSVFGVKQRLPGGTAIKFAKGGHVPGYAPGSDTVRAMLSPGEYVLNPKAVKAIGVKNLHALNALTPGGGQAIRKGGRQAFANGGDVVNDITKWNGHRYIWGGGANPSTGWDCSSFVNYIVGHDFKLNLPGGGSWASMTNNGASHGPVAAAYNNWNYGHGVPWSAAKKGDLAIEDNGAHIGFIIQDNVNKSSNETLMGFAARSTATGTGYENFFPSAFHLERFADDRGFGSQVFDNTIGAVLKPLASLALNGIEGLVNGALNHIPGGGPIPPLAKNIIDDIINAAKNKLTSNQGNYQFNPAATGPAGVGTSAGEIANGKQIYNYLLANLFGGHKIAAAGATASIWGESTWNPFAQGTGGRGLIGWTPPGTISNADFNGGMRTQLPAILRFVVNSGDQGAISRMFQSPSVLDAANIWGKDVERFGINDVHTTGVQLATRFMKDGGLIPTGVFDNGGTLAPGPNMIYNLTGKKEHLTRTDRIGPTHITLELGDTFKQAGLSEQQVRDIRYTVRTKGGQGPDAVQRAFGKS